jgi:putative transposase
MIQTAEQLSTSVGVSRACRTLQVPRSSLYRAREGAAVEAAVESASIPADPGSANPTPVRPPPPTGLSPAERAAVRDLLNSPRFQDHSPRQVWARLLDQGIYLCSWRTMYRILDACGEVRERRNQVRHPAYTKPELLATGPKQLWSWDITKLRGPMKGVYFYLYVILDVFSRYVVGWMVAEQESAELAQTLIETSCHRQGIRPAQLTLHADRGAPMVAKTMAELLSDLGVTKSHSRPHVSDDNPYSEAQFKTLKYRPDFPDRFGAVADARAWGHDFFLWYNHEHYHTALGLLTPAMVHDGQAPQQRAQRQQVLTAAYQAHPERFFRGAPTVPQLPPAVWINKPKETTGLDATLISSVELSQKA